MSLRTEEARPERKKAEFEPPKVESVKLSKEAAEALT